MGTTNQVSQPIIQVVIDIPVVMGPEVAGKEPVLRDFVCIRDPRSEAMIEGMTQ